MSQGTNSSRRKRTRPSNKSSAVNKSEAVTANVYFSTDDDIQRMNDNLGEQGPTTPYEAAAKSVNPRYNTDRLYRINCQRVVYAYEMKRRGYDVEARPFEVGDNFASSLFGGYKRVFSDQEWTRNYELGRNTKTVVEGIEGRMKEWGDGSRAVVEVVWKGGRKGHIFNVEQIGGVTYGIDAQSGKIFNIGDYISQSMPSKTKISRVDNLREVNAGNLNKCIRRRRT